MSNRESLDAYFIRIAEAVATRSTCDRRNVGAVIVLDKRIIATGYNGSPAGLPHCDEVGHEIKQIGGRDSCIRTVHAEANAIAQAAKVGTPVNGATIYTNYSPCYDCFKLIVNAGIKKIVCKEMYEGRFGMASDTLELAKSIGIELIVLEKSNAK
jgi:dCMP deaminase